MNSAQLISFEKKIASLFNKAKIRSPIHLYSNNEKALIKRSLNLLAKKLDPKVFFRVNRSQIINTHYIKEIHPYFHNKLQITLTTGEKVEVSHRQSAQFKNWNSL